MEFHIVVKPYVEKVLIFAKDAYVGEMICANPPADDDAEDLIYNGTIPETLAGQSIILQLLGKGGSTEYKFKDLFSKPVESSKNIIIVNAPQEMAYAFIKVPQTLRDLFGFPEYWFLADAEKQKIRLIRPEASLMEKISHGIDPAGKQFVKLVSFEVPKDYQNRLGDLHNIMLDCVFKVFCYASFKHLELKI